jgi:hypothetical protein
VHSTYMTHANPLNTTRLLHSHSPGLLLCPCAALGRLEDGSSKVVKAALQLVFAMIQHSPFGPRLAPNAFAATLAHQEGLLEELAPAADGEGEGEVWKSGTVKVGGLCVHWGWERASMGPGGGVCRTY